MFKRWGLIVMLAMLQGGFCRADDSGAAQEMVKIDGQPVKLARYAKAFIGEGNVTVEMAPYKNGDQSGAILLFHGIESDWDGKAFNHNVASAAYHGQSYITQYKGKNWYTLVTREINNGTMQYELFIPDIKGSILLTPSDGAAQLTSPLKIFQEYQQQASKK